MSQNPRPRPAPVANRRRTPCIAFFVPLRPWWSRRTVGRVSRRTYKRTKSESSQSFTATPCFRRILGLRNVWRGVCPATENDRKHWQGLTPIVNSDGRSMRTSRSTIYSLSQLLDRNHRQPLPESRLRADRQALNSECTHTHTVAARTDSFADLKTYIACQYAYGIWPVTDVRGLLRTVATYCSSTLLVEDRRQPSHNGRCRFQGAPTGDIGPRVNAGVPSLGRYCTA
ncbi:hypothetical protein V8E53_002197 [Lactarius tabidus]